MHGAPDGERVRGAVVTGAIGRLVEHATGDWSFEGTDAGSRFRWRYTFEARSPGAAPAVRGFVRLMWAGYMRHCADRCVALAEARD